MDTAALQAFVTVARTRSFSRAAEELFLTQPAISKRVAVLEAELDTRLFDRIGRQVILTEAGEALLPRAHKVILELEDSRRAIANLSGAVSGTLSMGTSHHIGLHRLPPVLRRYHRTYPQAALDLHFMDSEQACAAVLRGDLELAVVTLPLSPLPGLIATPVWPDPLSIVASRDHPLARVKTPKLADLARHGAILPAHGTYTRELLEQTFAPTGLSLQVSMSTNYLETIKMMVSVGLAWSVLPDTMIGGKQFTVIRVKGISFERTLGVVTHMDRTLSNRGKALISLLSERPEK